MYGSISAVQCIRDIYERHGLVGFYKGITASYFGISETIIHFVIYEFIKAQLRKHKESSCRDSYDPDVKSTRDFVQYMAAGAVSKTCASTLAYPHGKCFCAPLFTRHVLPVSSVARLEDSSSRLRLRGGIEPMF